MPSRTLIPALLAAFFCSALGACGDDAITVTPDADGVVEGSGGADPGATIDDASNGGLSTIAPFALSVHPLTRIGLDSKGRSALLLHLEVKDQFGQSIKALGRYRVELFRPGSLGSGGAQSQDRAWEADLRRPRDNALMFDNLVTRTYVLPLGGLPDWLLEWSRGSGNVSPAITVAFTPAGSGSGSEGHALRAGYQLSR